MARWRNFWLVERVEAYANFAIAYWVRNARQALALAALGWFETGSFVPAFRDLAADQFEFAAPAAARRARKDRKDFWILMKKHDISADTFKQEQKPEPAPGTV